MYLNYLIMNIIDWKISVKMYNCKLYLIRWPRRGLRRTFPSPWRFRLPSSCWEWSRAYSGTRCWPWRPPRTTETRTKCRNLFARPEMEQSEKNWNLIWINNTILSITKFTLAFLNIVDIDCWNRRSLKQLLFYTAYFNYIVNLLLQL